MDHSEKKKDEKKRFLPKRACYSANPCKYKKKLEAAMARSKPMMGVLLSLWPRFSHFVGNSFTPVIYLPRVESPQFLSIHMYIKESTNMRSSGVKKIGVAPGADYCSMSQRWEAWNSIRSSISPPSYCDQTLPLSLLSGISFYDISVS